MQQQQQPIFRLGGGALFSIGRFRFVWAVENTFDPSWSGANPASMEDKMHRQPNADTNKNDSGSIVDMTGGGGVESTARRGAASVVVGTLSLGMPSFPPNQQQHMNEGPVELSISPAPGQTRPYTTVSLEYILLVTFALCVIFSGASSLCQLSLNYIGHLGFPTIVQLPRQPFAWLLGAVGRDGGADIQWKAYEFFCPVLALLAWIMGRLTCHIHRCQSEARASAGERVSAGTTRVPAPPSGNTEPSPPSQPLGSNNNNNAGGAAAGSPRGRLSAFVFSLCCRRQAMESGYAIIGILFITLAHNTHVVFPLVIVTCNYLVFTALQRWRRCPYWLFMLLMWATHVGVMCANEYFQGYEYFYWVQRLLPTMEGSALLFGVEYKPLIPRLMRWHIAYRMYVLRMISFNYDMWEANRNAGAARERALQKHLLTCIDCAKLRECREKHGEQHHPYVSESGKRRETKHFFPMGFLSPRSQDSRALPTPMESTAVAVGWEKRWDESIGSSTRAAVGDDSCHTVPVSIYTGVPDAAFPSPLASLASINSMTSPRTKGAAFSSSPLAASHPPSFPATATANSIGMASADRVVDGGNSNGNGNTTLSDLASDESCWCYKLRTDYPRDTAQYTFVHYLAYLLFVPTLLCGPISSFNAFVSYMRSPSLAMPRRDKYLYALRIVFIYAVMIALQHTIFVNAFSMQIHLVQEMPAQAQGAYLYFYLAFLYLKFNFIWKTSRLFAMWSGIEVPENIIRCYANTCFTRDFWRSWHASFNLWIVRYMYIPMGGRKRLLFSIFPIFFFIAIWHDHVLHLLMWAFLICLVIAAETIIGGLYGKLASAFSREMEKGKEAEEDSQRGPVDGNSNRKSNVNGLNVWRAAACFARTRMTRCQRWYVQRVLVGCSGALAIGAQILVNVIGYSYQTDYTFNKENMAEEGMNSQGTIRRVLGLVRENAILCVVTFFYFYAVATMGALYMKKQSVAQRQDKARYGLQ